MDHLQEEYFQLKADFIPLTVIKLTHHNLDGIQKQLEKTIRKAPNYFQSAPILLDVTELKDQAQFDVEALLHALKLNRLITVAIRGADKKLAARAEQQGLALLNKAPLKEATKEKAEPTALNNQSPTKIITKPVRAGTQIYAKGGDLIILAGVNPGAECFADGSIHVYGPLRGRALAGINGDTTARIFCRSLEAELIAIAGHYQVNESIKTPNNSPHGMIQIYLNHEKLQINTL